MSDAQDNDTTQPVGGGAESTPDPTAPETPGQAPATEPEAPGTEPSSVPPSEPVISPDDGMGGGDTVAANDELQGGAER